VGRQTFSGIVAFSDVHYSQGALHYTDFRLKQDDKFSYKSIVSGPCSSQIQANFTSELGREWPQVRASFLLSRRRVDHVLQTFLPTGCLVCLSWISFLIPPYIVPGRMVLLVTLLLVVFSTYQGEQ